MNQLLQNLMGMGGMTDQVIATDFLISAKAGVRNYAVAITETATPELKAALRAQLNDAIATHEKITAYMMAKGYYHPHNLGEQLKVDLKVSDTALNLAEKS
ncbi:spore coat protein [Neobacillus sp. MM2021_6]|uniref:spore coat protein n=1 Tax=Bacillaceae TaxID=186817 RepID=UPI001407B3C0|nr:MULTISPECIES: spore coat protein [Bacillaceae]MBO0962475.1 spore coat protein [Neobacillus sp. MM2021_6]NHC18990.1 spore coat protein [Bacillus sp. MM2020_4]